MAMKISFRLGHHLNSWWVILEIFSKQGKYEFEFHCRYDKVDAQYIKDLQRYRKNEPASYGLARLVTVKTLVCLYCEKSILPSWTIFNISLG